MVARASVPVTRNRSALSSSVAEARGEGSYQSRLVRCHPLAMKPPRSYQCLSAFISGLNPIGQLDIHINILYNHKYTLIACRAHDQLLSSTREPLPFADN